MYAWYMRIGDTVKIEYSDGRGDGKTFTSVGQAERYLRRRYKNVMYTNGRTNDLVPR